MHYGHARPLARLARTLFNTARTHAPWPARTPFNMADAIQLFDGSTVDMLHHLAISTDTIVMLL
jgi:hypothetical protein